MCHSRTDITDTTNGHESIFFAWYDPDDTGGAEAFEIAVKYDRNSDEWRIANKAFDTFSDIVLSQQDADTLNAMSTSIQNGGVEDFVAGDDIRVYLGAAYEDITNVINSNVDVSLWDFSQGFTSSRSTYYIEIPNGTPDTTQQVKVAWEGGEWVLKTEEEILVNIPAFSVVESNDPLTPIDESATVLVGGDGAELISAGVGADTMYGRGGADTYSINSGDADSTTLVSDAFGVKGDVINEIGGDIASTLGDSIQFTALEAIDSVTFERTKIRFEKPEATLKITTNNGDDTSDIAHIFDHYNPDMPFRQVEQLLFNEGWQEEQIWNLIADGEGSVNRDVLIGDSGANILKSGGGVDVMQGGAGEDEFWLGVSLEDILALGQSANDGYTGDIANAHGNVTMLRDFMAGEDDINLSLLGITDKAEVGLETSGDRTYLVHTDAGDSTKTVLAEFTDTSDLTNFNKDEDIKVADL